MTSRVEQRLKELPDRPGVYLFKGAQGEVLYVGKAVSLRKRVLSYFRPGRPRRTRAAAFLERRPSGSSRNAERWSVRPRQRGEYRLGQPLTAKLMRLVSQTADLDWVVTGSEAEALLYESGQIKESQPKYNVLLRDDKSYPYLKITAEEPFPRLFIGRVAPAPRHFCSDDHRGRRGMPNAGASGLGSEEGTASVRRVAPAPRHSLGSEEGTASVSRGGGETGIKTIGPFAHAGLLRQAFDAIRGVIPFRTCRVMPKRACLDYHLGLCPAPCEGKISQEEYRQNLSRIFRLMEGKKEQVIEELRLKMKQASDARRYEDAAKYRDQIGSLLELAARPRRFIPAQALPDLQSVLRLPRLPRRIVGFDVSNIFGREAVGSMVTFVDGRPFKDGYKRFKIKTVTGIDDYAMMREIVRRQFKGAGPQVPGPAAVTGPLPDLILVDGGRGHLNAALEVLRELQMDLPAAGIAKEYEVLFLPGRSEPVVLPPESRALQLAQRVRDEAHRFAIGYHRLLRGKDALTSALDRIPGIGPRKKQDLLVRFGSVEAMRKASVEDLAQVRGVSEPLAQRISQQLGRG